VGVQRDRGGYLPAPQAAGSQRLYAVEGSDGRRVQLAAVGQGVWQDLGELSPGLWLVRVISGYQTAAEIQITPRDQVLSPGGVVPVNVTGRQYPRIYLADPVYSAVAEAAGRASVVEIDVSSEGGHLWGARVGNDTTQLLITLIAARAAGYGGQDRES
jgi:hypothetical protein